MKQYRLGIILTACMLVAAAGFALAQSAGNQGSQVTSWTYTSFPLYGAVVTPSDSTVFAPSNIRVDADGAVTARCAGDGPGGTAITLTMVAGEFFPCQVIMVLDTGTDAIAINRFY